MGRIKGWRIILLSIVVTIFIIETVLLGSTLLQPEKVRPTIDFPELVTLEPSFDDEVVWSAEEVNTDPKENSGYIFNMQPTIYPFYNDLRGVEYFWVDFGVYEDQDNIVSVQKSLQEVGLYTTIHPLDDGFKHLMTGPFKSYEEAEAGRDLFLLKHLAP